MNICLYGAASNDIDSAYIEAGERFGEIMAEAGHTLVFGGGGNGMMGAAARGAAAKNGKIIGIAPKFFNADGILFNRCTEFIYTTTMRERKQKMEDLADAFIMTPGGIGTYEEFFEILTLKSLDRHHKPIAVLNTLGYFAPLDNMLIHTAENGFMSDSIRSLYHTADTPENALNYLCGKADC